MKTLEKILEEAIIAESESRGFFPNQPGVDRAIELAKEKLAKMIAASFSYDEMKDTEEYD